MGLLKKIIGYLKKDETELAKASIGAKAYGLVDEYMAGRSTGPKTGKAAEKYVLDQFLSDNGSGIYGRIPSANKFERINLEGLISEAVNSYRENNTIRTKARAKPKAVPMRTVQETKDRKSWSPADDAPYRDLNAYFDRKAGRKNDAKKDNTLVIWAKNAGIPVIGDERMVLIDSTLQDMYKNQASK